MCDFAGKSSSYLYIGHSDKKPSKNPKESKKSCKNLAPTAAVTFSGFLDCPSAFDPADCNAPDHALSAIFTALKTPLAPIRRADARHASEGQILTYPGGLACPPPVRPIAGGGRVQENDRQTPERLERIKASAKITPHDGLLSASAALTTSPTVPPREARGDLSGTLAAVPLGGVYPPCTHLVPTLYPPNRVQKKRV